MANAHFTAPVARSNRDMDKASLLLDRLGANLDLLYTLACKGHIEEMDSATLASALDCAMDLCGQAKHIIDGGV